MPTTLARASTRRPLEQPLTISIALAEVAWSTLSFPTSRPRSCHATEHQPPAHAIDHTRGSATVFPRSNRREADTDGNRWPSLHSSDAVLMLDRGRPLKPGQNLRAVP